MRYAENVSITSSVTFQWLPVARYSVYHKVKVKLSTAVMR